MKLKRLTALFITGVLAFSNVAYATDDAAALLSTADATKDKVESGLLEEPDNASKDSSAKTSSRASSTNESSLESSNMSSEDSGVIYEDADALTDPLDNAVIYEEDEVLLKESVDSSLEDDLSVEFLDEDSIFDKNEDNMIEVSVSTLPEELVSEARGEIVDDSLEYIVDSFELSVPDGTEFPVTITFDASVEADDNVYLLHKNTTEELAYWETIFPDEVSDGEITATFDSLSPVVVVATDNEKKEYYNSFEYSELSGTIDGLRITVSGNMPKDAGLSVIPMDVSYFSEYVDTQTDGVLTKLYDITVFDSYGNIYEPVEYNECLNVCFENLDVIANGQVRIIHIDEENQIATVMSDVVDASETGTAVSFDTEVFSPYGVSVLNTEENVDIDILSKHGTIYHMYLEVDGEQLEAFCLDLGLSASTGQNFTMIGEFSDSDIKKILTVYYYSDVAMTYSTAQCLVWAVMDGFNTESDYRNIMSQLSVSEADQDVIIDAINNVTTTKTFYTWKNDLEATATPTTYQRFVAPLGSTKDLDKPDYSQDTDWQENYKYTLYAANTTNRYNQVTYWEDYNVNLRTSEPIIRLTSYSPQDGGQNGVGSGTTDAVAYEYAVIGGVRYRTEVNVSSCYSSNQYLTSVYIGENVRAYTNTLIQAFYNCPNLGWVDISNLQFHEPLTDTRYAFGNSSGLTNVNMTGVDTSAVTTMANMFSGCQNLLSVEGIESWDVNSVTAFSYMFNNCKKLPALDLGSWSFASATDMNAMFYNCQSLVSANLSGWDVSAVTNFAQMFSGVIRYEFSELQAWTPISATNMSYMFAFAGNRDAIAFAWTIDGSDGLNLAHMFEGTLFSEIDLSEMAVNNWSGISSIAYMFSEGAATEVNINGWDISHLSGSSVQSFLTSSNLKRIGTPAKINTDIGSDNHMSYYILSLNYLEEKDDGTMGSTVISCYNADMPENAFINSEWVTLLYYVGSALTYTENVQWYSDMTWLHTDYDWFTDTTYSTLAQLSYVSPATSARVAAMYLYGRTVSYYVTLPMSIELTDPGDGVFYADIPVEITVTNDLANALSISLAKGTFKNASNINWTNWTLDQTSPSETVKTSGNYSFDCTVSGTPPTDGNFTGSITCTVTE